jgi:multidrug resistance efflux pump
MIPLAIRRAVLVALLGPSLLAACSRGDDTAVAAPAPAYAAVARGRIDVEGGVLSLAFPREGVLASVDAREGDHVRQGQVLAALDPAPAKLAVAAAQAELDQARAQAGLVDARLDAAKRRTDRLAAAERAGAGDGPGTDEARDAANDLAAQRGAARAAVTAAEQKLAAARFEQDQGTLRAPVDADVVRVNAQPGVSVSPSSGPLFVLLPRTQRIVRADLSEAYLDVVRQGTQALVSADASPDARPWHAHVLRIGPVVGASALEEDPQLRAGSRTAECVLAFDGADAPRVGQRVLVRFGGDAARAAERALKRHPASLQPS